MTQIRLEDEYKEIAGAQKVLGDRLGDPVYLYCRSSDKIQAEEGRESLARQLVFADERGKSEGYYIPLEMVYWDVWTGKDADRPEFYEMLQDIKQGKKSDIVLIDRTDRLSRRTAVYYVLAYDLTRYGVEPIFEDDEDELIRHIKVVLADLEGKERSYRQIQANKARARKGYVTSKVAPFGYQFTEDKRQYRIDERGSVWVKRIFEWTVSGKSLAWIARQLSRKIKTPRGKDEWGTSTLHVILKNEVYKGVYVANRSTYDYVWEGGRKKRVSIQKPEDEWINVSVPAIISEDMWDEAQIILQRNKQRSLRNARKNEWLLSGLVKCVCGYCRYSQRRKRKRKLKSGETGTVYKGFYVCGDKCRTYKKERCKQGDISKNRLEGFVVEAIDMMFTDPGLWEPSLEEFGREISHWQGHVELHEGRIEEIDSQLKTLLEMALENRTETARKLFSEKQAELENEKGSHEKELGIARQRLEAVKSRENRREAVMAAIEKYKDIGGIGGLPFEKQRELVTQLVEEVVVNTC